MRAPTCLEMIILLAVVLVGLAWTIGFVNGPFYTSYDPADACLGSFVLQDFSYAPVIGVGIQTPSGLQLACSDSYGSWVDEYRIDPAIRAIEPIELTRRLYKGRLWKTSGLTVDGDSQWLVTSDTREQPPRLEVRDLREQQPRVAISESQLDEKILLIEPSGRHMLVGGLRTVADSENAPYEGNYELRFYDLETRRLSSIIELADDTDYATFHRAGMPGFWFVCRKSDGTTDLASLDEGKLRLKTVLTVPVKIPLDTLIEPLSDGLTGILLSPNAGTVELMSFETGERELLASDIAGMAWGSENTHFIRNKALRCYSMNGRLFLPVASRMAPFVSSEGRILISPDRARLAIASTIDTFVYKQRVHEVRIYDLSTRQRIATLSQFHAFACPLFFFDEDRLAIAESRYGKDFAATTVRPPSSAGLRSSGSAVISIWDIEKATAAEQSQ